MTCKTLYLTARKLIVQELCKCKTGVTGKANKLKRQIYIRQKKVSRKTIHWQCNEMEVKSGQDGESKTIVIYTMARSVYITMGVR